MQVTLGPVTRTAERFPGDKIAHNTADLLVNGVKIGTVHDSGYAPKWAYNLSEFRSKPEVAKHIWGGSAVKPTDYLIHCDAGFTSPESARAQVESRLTEFDKLTAPPPEKLVWEHRPRTKNCAGLAYAGPYVISKRPGNFTLSYRPPGEHVSLGSHPTLHDAKRAAKDHNADKRKAAGRDPQIHGEASQALEKNRLQHATGKITAAEYQANKDNIRTMHYRAQHDAGSPDYRKVV